MFPAHAGMNRRFGKFVSETINVSRTRGDEPALLENQRVTFRCFPHTRG